ncbi:MULTISPECIES: VOC family protein [unclassified Brenneria]|uniref:VOC family protein n=1 Tax=unclassified Brenneria TaxID=2634434 RepID=UPI0018F0E041|nr:VOC family protein [Brenneria sp. L3-3C-1]MBJ7221236.1 VOC family protein [Brenneria sp. L3-3C-1]MEE3642479.1 VOC family protein [Brenneria sp. L3_3C_1]
MTLSLDHLVLNAQFETDSAAALLSQLGFTLTPRGYHSMGSINHLVMFAHHYLEILGLPPGEPVRREELLAGPAGLDGLVFRSQDIAASAAAIQRAGFTPQPVRTFSRPVDIDGQRQQARFSTVHLPADSFSAARIYFCQHHTPELVWRDEWQHHQNGVTRISQLTVVTDDPASLARDYQALGTPAPGFELAFLHRDAFVQRYRHLLTPDPDRDSQFAAMRFHGGDRALIARQARALGLPLSEQPERLLVALPAFNCLCEFLP